MAECLIHRGGNATDIDLVTATESDILIGKVGVNSDGDSISGAIPIKNVGITTPTTVNQIIVPSKSYVNSDVIIAGDPNLIAENIKKGVVLFGITGKFEGYVADIGDIYNRNAWGKGFSAQSVTRVVSSRGGQVYIFYQIGLIDLRAYSKVKCKLNTTSGKIYNTYILIISDSELYNGGNHDKLRQLSRSNIGASVTSGGDFYLVADVSLLNTMAYIYIGHHKAVTQANSSFEDVVERLWLE